MEIESYIAAWDATLAPGQSERSRCPKCAAPEQSFVVTKQEDGNLAWICHRASCGYFGRYRGTGTHSGKWRPDITGLAPQVDFDLAKTKDGMIYDRLSGGYYAAIKHPRHGEIGFQLRWYDGRKPKVRSYRTAGADCEFMHWEYTPDCLTVIVEDWLSARRVKECGYSAVALLGTTFNAKRAAELKECGIEGLVFALDPDAYALALKYAREWKPFFQSVSAVRLRADPKDTPHEELRNYLGTEDTIRPLPESTL